MTVKPNNRDESLLAHVRCSRCDVTGKVKQFRCDLGYTLRCGECGYEVFRPWSEDVDVLSRAAMTPAPEPPRAA